MCFCASGSFAASGALAVVGAVTLGVARREERLIAAIPLIFAAQQAIEGMQWLTPHPSPTSLALGYGFLVFAFVFWPAYVPIAAYRVEHDRGRRRILRWLIGVGALTSLVLVWVMVTQPLQIQMHPLGIAYLINRPFGWFGTLWYAAATCGSLLASSHRQLRWFGAAALVSAMLSLIIYDASFISVWCFFAAILSVLVFFYVSRKRNRTSK